MYTRTGNDKFGRVLNEGQFIYVDRTYFIGFIDKNRKDNNEITMAIEYYDHVLKRNL